MLMICVDQAFRFLLESTKDPPPGTKGAKARRELHASFVLLTDVLKGTDIDKISARVLLRGFQILATETARAGNQPNKLHKLRVIQEDLNQLLEQEERAVISDPAICALWAQIIAILSWDATRANAAGDGFKQQKLMATVKAWAEGLAVISRSGLNHPERVAGGARARMEDDNIDDEDVVINGNR